ncbi:hypothetical protein ACQKMN_16950 [Ureibacillus composti]
MGKIKSIYNKFSLIFLGIMLLLFLIIVVATLLIEGIKGTDSITLISLVAVILSLPGTINVLIDEFKPQKKTYKLSCKCPKCKHLIEMDMKEE